MTSRCTDIDGRPFGDEPPVDPVVATLPERLRRVRARPSVREEGSS